MAASDMEMFEAQEHIAALEAENERLNQLSVDLRACMVEARHKLGLEQDKNDELRAVAQEVLSYTDYIRPLGPRGQVLRNAALAALDKEVGDRNDIDQICRNNSAAVEEMMAANRGGWGVSNQKMCPLLAAGVMASPSDRIAEKIQAGWDRCQGIDCAWWDKERGECAVAPKWTTLTTEEMGEA